MPLDNPHAATAARIRQARELAGLTQEAAAAQLGVTSKTLRRWESGASAGFLRELDAIAAAYGVDREQLVVAEQVDRLTVVERTLERVQDDLAQLRAQVDELAVRMIDAKGQA